MKERTTDSYWRADTTTQIKPAVMVVLYDLLVELQALRLIKNPSGIASMTRIAPCAAGSD